MHSVLEISPVFKLSSVIAPVGHTLIHALHAMHLLVIILKPICFFSLIDLIISQFAEIVIHHAPPSLASNIN
jgi:hypothetical protein